MKVSGGGVPDRGNHLCKGQEIGLCSGHDLRLLLPPRDFEDLKPGFDVDFRSNSQVETKSRLQGWGYGQSPPTSHDQRV